MTDLSDVVDEVIEENREDYEAYKNGDDEAVHSLIANVAEKTDYVVNARDVHQLIMAKADGDDV